MQREQKLSFAKSEFVIEVFWDDAFLRVPLAFVVLYLYTHDAHLIIETEICNPNQYGKERYNRYHVGCVSYKGSKFYQLSLIVCMF